MRIYYNLIALALFGCNNENTIIVQESPDQKTAVVKNDSVAANGVDTLPAFNKTVSYKTISFKVTSPNKHSNNTFIIEPSGYANVNTPVKENINGLVSDVIVDDIDGDDNPEVAVIIRSGEDENAVFYMYSSNKNKSMSSVYLPESKNNSQLFSGYKGHDEYNFVENSFIHRFPVYEGDVKSNKVKQIQYKLQKGETSKQLIQQKVLEY